MTTHLIRPLHPTAGVTRCDPREVESRFCYPGMAFFYHARLDAQLLRSALARVLDAYPEYCSTFTAGPLSLNIHHAAGVVHFEQVKSARSLHWLMSETREGRTTQIEPRVSKLNVLLAREVALAVKLTETRDGCALTVVWNHAVGDMHSTMLLMRAWANAYAGRPFETPVRVGDRGGYLRAVMPDPSAARSAARHANLRTAAAHRLALLRPAQRVRVEYGWSELEALRAALGSGKRLSYNDVVCAHVYLAMRRMAGATGSNNLCLVVNYRKRLGLSQRLIGNMTSLVSEPVGELDTAALVATRLRSALQDYSTKHADYQATRRTFDAKPRTLDRLRLVSRQFVPGSGDILITNWNSFGAYELSFGAGMPVLFSPVVLGATGLAPWVMIVYDLPQSRGLGLMAGLPRSVAAHWHSREGRALLRVPEPAKSHEPAPRRIELPRADLLAPGHLL